MTEERTLREQIVMALDHNRDLLLERFDRLAPEQQDGFEIALIAHAPAPDGGGPLEELWAHYRTIEDRDDLAEFYRKAADQIATIDLDPSWHQREPLDLSQR